MTTQPIKAIDAAVAGSSMHVLRAGRGEPVILAHSYLWDARMWQPQIAALSPYCEVIVPELWGHGRSGALPANTINLRALARQHLELFDVLGLDTVSIVGLSVGAMWAAELALLAPDRVKRLVLMDSYLGPEPAEQRQRYFEMLGAVEKLGSVPPPMFDALVPMFLSDTARRQHPHLETAFRDRLVGWDRGRLLDSVVPLGRLIFGRRDSLPDLANLGMPGLVLTGSADTSRPPHEGRHMAEIMDFAFAEIADAGHIASLEQPVEVNRRLLDFLGVPVAP
jgi:pimeloyl-ACP methyl ester carboxylesterase